MPVGTIPHAVGQTNGSAIQQPHRLEHLGVGLAIVGGSMSTKWSSNAAPCYFEKRDAVGGTLRACERSKICAYFAMEIGGYLPRNIG
jgi:hypothetical protein